MIVTYIHLENGESLHDVFGIWCLTLILAQYDSQVSLYFISVDASEVDMNSDLQFNDPLTAHAHVF